MKPLRCIIADDERLARQSLRRKIASFPEVSIVGEADSVAATQRAVATLRPDLLLLDVQMADGTGFDALRSLKHPPVVIFVTAFDRFALRAFEVNAVDYLLKPVQEERLGEALKRAAARKVTGALRTHETLAPFKDDDLALLEVGSSGTFVPVRDVLAVQADQKYTRVLLPGGWGPLVRQSLDMWGRRLPAPMFLRLDRKLIVNMHALVNVRIAARAVQLEIGPHKCPFTAGRSAAAKLKMALQGR